jgi:hypothetical protein
LLLFFSAGIFLPGAEKLRACYRFDFIGAAFSAALYKISIINFL